MGRKFELWGILLRWCLLKARGWSWCLSWHIKAWNAWAEALEMLLERKGQGNISFSVSLCYYHLLVFLYLSKRIFRVLHRKELVSTLFLHCFSILLALHPVIILLSKSSARLKSEPVTKHRAVWRIISFPGNLKVFNLFLLQILHQECGSITVMQQH